MNVFTISICLYMLSYVCERRLRATESARERVKQGLPEDTAPNARQRVLERERDRDREKGQGARQ